MKNQAELAYLRLRLAAANVAANVAIDCSVKVTHQRFAAAYARRISAIVISEGVIAPVVDAATMDGLRSTWAKMPPCMRTRPVPVKAMRSILGREMISSPSRLSANRRSS
jgi:hypothetical protein